MLKSGEGGSEFGELATLLSAEEEELEVLIMAGERRGVSSPSMLLLIDGRCFWRERNAFEAFPLFFCSRLYSQSRPNTGLC